MRSALILGVLLTGCGGPGRDAAAQLDPPPDGPVVPVVTSVVGMTPSGGGGTGRGGTTTTPGRTGTTISPRNSYGESEAPITVPSTPPSVSDPAMAAAAESVARSFLERFWAPAARTMAQVANDVAPFSTDRLLAVYRDPVRADETVPGAGVGTITVQATAVTNLTATVTGRGTLAAAPDQVVYRTLTLLVGPDGVWRVEAVK